MNKHIKSQIEIAKQVLCKNAEADYIGEDITQLAHALEGGYFAAKAKHSPDVVVASLFHDIGHYAENIKRPEMDGLGVLHHEWVGARIMRELGFNTSVCSLIKNHVDAKRYLAKKKLSYYEKLSAASRETLEFQGGPMNTSELLEFENNNLFKEIIQVRANDEKAKEIDLRLPQSKDFNNYMLASLDNVLFKKYSPNKEILLIDTNSVEKLSIYLHSMKINLEEIIILAANNQLKSFQKFEKRFEKLLGSLYIEPLLNNPNENSVHFILEKINSSMINKYIFVIDKANIDTFTRMILDFPNIKL
ncbi:hypothetical protein CDV26_02630 [Francisella halioticida]|uniref:HD domain-containing protein n=1 Tax=Francisella halioticida TaxID=549298 RepID=A0ABN5AU26_9GAMM|nr:HD domain-containing protein [Francisella halioticida]ASG67438.1 hypothetical protein CDV26_02630 [Francisella halioticida]